VLTITPAKHRTFTVVGESKRHSAQLQDRITEALTASGYRWPQGQLRYHPTPHGAHYGRDLLVLLSILDASHQVNLRDGWHQAAGHLVGGRVHFGYSNTSTTSAIEHWSKQMSCQIGDCRKPATAKTVWGHACTACRERLDAAAALLRSAEVDERARCTQN